MGCQKWLHLCAPIFLTYFWRSRWSEIDVHELGMLLIISYSIMRYFSYIILRVWQKYITYYLDLHCRKIICQSLISMRFTPERRVTEGWKQAFTTILMTYLKVSEGQIKQNLLPVDPCQNRNGLLTMAQIGLRSATSCCGTRCSTLLLLLYSLRFTNKTVFTAWGSVIR